MSPTDFRLSNTQKGKTTMTFCRTTTLAILALTAVQASPAEPTATPAANLSQKPRVIVTTDGEIDDECSMVRFLLYANEFDVEGIITSSSQSHAGTSPARRLPVALHGHH